MGCDIHIVLEQRNKDQIEGVKDWVGLRDLSGMGAEAMVFHLEEGSKLASNYVGWKLKQRDYDFFAAVAQVRGKDKLGYKERGMPPDASDLSLVTLEPDGDLHSHSYLSARELVPLLLRVKEDVSITELVKGKLLGDDVTGQAAVLSRWLDIDIDEYRDIDDYRIVFAFDN